MGSTSTTTTVWRCDRCGKEEVTSDSGRPEGWDRLGLSAQFDRHAHLFARTPPAEICPACVEHFTKIWLSGGEA